MTSDAPFLFEPIAGISGSSLAGVNRRSLLGSPSSSATALIGAVRSLIIASTASSNSVELSGASAHTCGPMAARDERYHVTTHTQRGILSMQSARFLVTGGSQGIGTVGTIKALSSTLRPFTDPPLMRQQPPTQISPWPPAMSTSTLMPMKSYDFNTAGITTALNVVIASLKTDESSG